MLSISIAKLPCFCHPGVSWGGLPRSSDSGTVWRFFSTASAGMAPEEENRKAFFRLCVDLPGCNNVRRDVECASSSIRGRVESDFVKCDFCSVGGLHSLGTLLSQMSGDK